MKILFCAYDRPGHIATGPNAWLQRLIPDLRNTYGLDISTFFIYNGAIEECPTLQFFQSNGLPTFSIDRDQVPFVADQVKEILQIIKTNSLVVVVANLVIPAFYAAKYLKPFNIPVIGVLHSNDAFYKSVIKKFIIGNDTDRLTVAVSVSDFIKSIADSDDLKCAVIPCGTPLKQEHAIRENAQLKVMYAGRLETTQKEILKLTTAFLHASIKNSSLEFSIYGSGSQENEVKLLLNNCKHTHKVYFKGSVAPSEIQNVMLNHQVFTLMSDYEGMPIALMEAMACGLVPVCLYEESGIKEIISQGVNGLIFKNREEDYQDKLKTLVDDQLLWKQMSENAIQTIKTKYSSDITHKQWFELLNGYRNSSVKKVKIPLNMKLNGELLYYGDNRKPLAKEIIAKQLKEFWLKIKLKMRPRARLRRLLKK